LGATRESILKQFFLETVIVVFISGGAGLIISYGLCGLVNLLPTIRISTELDASWKLAALTISLLGLIAVLSALYPANRAASVDPIEALRFEAGDDADRSIQGSVDCAREESRAHPADDDWHFVGHRGGNSSAELRLRLPQRASLYIRSVWQGGGDLLAWNHQRASGR